MSLNSVYWERVLGAVLFRANGQIDRQTDRQTDRCDEANNRFSQFCNCISKLCASAISLAKL